MQSDFQIRHAREDFAADPVGGRSRKKRSTMLSQELLVGVK
jgi:hypothetical protein